MNAFPSQSPPAGKVHLSRRDRFSLWAGFACAVHCALTPLAVLLIPSLGLGFLENPWLEGSLLVAVLLLGGNAVAHGWKVHRRMGPAVLFVAAFAAMCLEYFVTGSVAWMIRIFAAVGLVAALLWARGSGPGGHDACLHEGEPKVRMTAGSRKTRDADG